MVNSSRFLVLAFLSVSAAFKLSPIGWSRERPTPGGGGSEEARKCTQLKFLGSHVLPPHTAHHLFLWNVLRRQRKFW
jgi:hypothetical protein